MRNFIKNFIYFLCYLISFFYDKKEVFVLMYHSVGDGSWKLTISAEEFKKQLGYLKKKYNIVSLEKIVSYIKEENVLPHKTVALTFDDGYEDIYTNVFPIIKELGVPITIFLTSDQEDDANYQKVKMRNLERLTLNMVREMVQSGLVNFEAHGHKHLNLVAIANNDEQLKEEIDENIKLIKEVTSYNPCYFAYAYGAKDEKIKEFIKQKGFEAAFSITEGLVNQKVDPFSINRIQVDNTINFILFKMRLSGAIDLNRKFTDKVRKIWK